MPSHFAWLPRWKKVVSQSCWSSQWQKKMSHCIFLAPASLLAKETSLNILCLFKHSSFDKMFQISTSTRPSPCPSSPPLVCPSVWTEVPGPSPVVPKHLSRHCRALALFGDTETQITLLILIFSFSFFLSVLLYSPFFAMMPCFLPLSHICCVWKYVKYLE